MVCYGSYIQDKFFALPLDYIHNTRCNHELLDVPKFRPILTKFSYYNTSGQKTANYYATEYMK